MRDCGIVGVHRKPAKPGADAQEIMAYSRIRNYQTGS
jgi:hypothetical protein